MKTCAFVGLELFQRCAVSPSLAVSWSENSPEKNGLLWGLTLLCFGTTRRWMTRTVDKPENQRGISLEFIWRIDFKFLAVCHLSLPDKVNTPWQRQNAMLIIGLERQRLDKIEIYYLNIWKKHMNKRKRPACTVIVSRLHSAQVIQIKQITNMKHNHKHASKMVPVHFVFTNKTANSVCIAGTFNNWKPESKALHHSGIGRWWKDTVLAPGTYEYCLIVDGQWMPDPLALETVPNPFGGRNSVLRVFSSPEMTHLFKAEKTPLAQHTTSDRRLPTILARS